MKKIFSLMLALLCLLTSCSCSGTVADIYSEISTAIEKIMPTTQEVVGVKYEYYEISDPQFNSCYNQLNKSQKDIYRRIYAISEEMSEGFVSLGSYYDGALNDVTVAYNAFLNDNSEIFWMPNTYILATSGYGSDAKTVIAFEYSDSENRNSYTVADISERNRLKAELDNKVDYILSQTDDLSNEYEKEKFLNDYLCNNVTYSETGEFVGTAYGALVLNSALCEGYSRAFKLLCNRAGIECDLVTGKSEGEGHMWNRVNIDRKLSYVDVTWNDRAEYRTYTYFNITEEQLKFDHSFFPLLNELSQEEISGGCSFNFTYKECTYTGNTYYEKTGRVLWLDSFGTAAEKIKETYKSGGSYTEFMFETEDARLLFERDSNGFVAKIQSSLDNIYISGYAQERDTLILFFE